MTDVPTLPSTPTSAADAAPPLSAALIVAATLAFVGAAITIGALFPDYWDAPSFALLDDTASLAQTAVFGAALLLGGVLLLTRRSAPIGSAMLAVVVAFALQPRVDDIVTLADDHGPRAGTGFALITAGFVLALLAAILSAFVALRPRTWSMLGGARPLAVLAALFGFGASVGYAMNPFTIGGAGDLSFNFSGGSPLDTGDPTSSRGLWAAILVVVLLTVVPPIAVSVSGRIGSGLALGLLFGIGGIAALRLGAIYGSSEVAGRRVSVGLDGAEGTWTFLAAGGAALIVTWFGLAAGGVRRPRAASMAPVSSGAPPDEPPSLVGAASGASSGTGRPGRPAPVVVGDDASAIVEAGDTSSADDSDTAESERIRVDPMPAADDTTMTWNAAQPGDDRPPQ